MIRAVRHFTHYCSQHLLLALAMTIAALLFLSMLTPFLESIAMAAIFALGIYVVLEKISLRVFKHRHKPPFAFIIVFHILFLSVVGTFVGVSFLKIYNYFLGPEKDATYKAMRELAGFASTKLGSIIPYLNSWLQELNIGTVTYESTLQSIPTAIIAASGNMASNLPAFTIQAIVFFVMLNFFLVSHGSLHRFALRIQIFSPDDVNRLVKTMKVSSYDSLMTNAVVGTLQASVVTIGAAVAGYGQWILIFFFTFIVSFIPVAGGSSVAFLLALIGFISDKPWVGFLMIAVGLITGVSDNIVRSYLISNSKDKGNPLLIFVAIIGAVFLFGFSGLFIGPFVLNMCLHLMPQVFPRPKRVE